MSANINSTDFAQRLIHWQRQAGRHDLPWQSSPPNAYWVWLSEIMLQQTQVQTVIPYFVRFTQRFPNLQALANATEQEVLALWSGLGYYQRGRNLLACAKEIQDRFGGHFPNNAQALMTLPGIGPSTAAAIASVVYQERVAILDGNVKRVLARVTCADAPWGSPALEKMLWQEAQARLPQSAPQMPIYTQAIMDLGAMVCRAKNPDCPACPVRADCKAHASQTVADFPKPKLKKITSRRQAHWVVLCNPDGVWLMQQPTRGIWPGLWVPWRLDLQAMPNNWDQTVSQLIQVIEMKHAFTHYKLDISAGVIRWPMTSKPILIRPGQVTAKELRAGGLLPVGAPSGLVFFSWHQAFDLPLPAPVRTLLSKLYPFEKASGGESRKSSPKKSVV
ncbi:A/G-specific adenine glycosylase [beta proteobacterium MWH-UniP1]